SRWTDYTETGCPVPEASREQKEKFVIAALKELQPERVLDVGCNTGDFSLLAARGGAAVVSIDSDDACVGHLWRRAEKENLPIPPRVVDISRPTAAVGWRNTECRSFLERATDSFDAVLFLAVTHHLAIQERVPFAEIAKLIADTTRDAAIVEYVGPNDP